MYKDHGVVENFPSLVYAHEYINGNTFVSDKAQVSYSTEEIVSVALLSYDRVNGWQIKEIPNKQKEV